VRDIRPGLQGSALPPERHLLAGRRVVQVADGGPAAAAGFLQGDILVRLDGTAVTNADDLQGLLGPNRVGSAVSAAIID